MIADRQGTTLDERSEPLTKLSSIGDNVLFGAAGSSNYIQDFKECLTKNLVNRGDIAYKEVLRKTITEYSSRVIREGRQMELDFGIYLMPRDSMIRGIVSAYDDDNGVFHIFDFITPHLPEDVTLTGHAIVGSGDAPASTLFRVADSIMEYLHAPDNKTLEWKHLSIETVERFGWWVMQTVAGQDIYTGVGVDRMVLTKKGIAEEPWHYDMHPADPDDFKEMVRSFFKDIPPQQVGYLKSLLGFDD